MTRFARARGSKASNEKAPEDATPWEVMKEQLVQAKKEADETKNRQAAENQRIENYENFLKEHKVQKRKAEWCDFPETQQQKSDSAQTTSQPSKKKKKNKHKNNFTTGSANENGMTENIVENVAETMLASKKKKKNKQKNNSTTNSANDNGMTENIAENVAENTEKKSKKKNKNKNDTSVSVETETQNVENKSTLDQKKKNKKGNKTGMVQANQIENGSADTDNTNVAPEHQNRQLFNQNQDNSKQQPKKKKDKKIVNGQPVRRKEIDNSFQLIINGKEVELVRFDGFPIMKKDAERLADLRNNMIKKGIPKSEVQRTMKLERRRAEKALARLKREVCYNCRKGGHNLSDCPDLKSKIPGADVAEGVCFKCGSTEHRQFECKVQRDKEFRFATCFICKEPGHIARQCPDNPKGLYPNGGSCKLCGDVTHLRKDCPTANEKKEETSVKLQTLESTDNIEDIGQQVKTAVIETVKKPKKIKF